MSNIHIFGGGTFNHVRNHLSLAAVSFGTTARQFKQHLPHAVIHLTRMASESSKIITNEDLMADLQKVLDDPFTSVIIMSAAICDYEGSVGNTSSGLHAKRLSTSIGPTSMELIPAPKLLKEIRTQRPDIFVVGFKTTTSDSEHTMVHKAAMQYSSITFVNDTVTRVNLLVSNCRAVTHGDRNQLIEKVVSLINNPIDNILYEDDDRVLIQLPTHKYFSMDTASEMAGEAWKLKYPDSKPCINPYWDNVIEGGLWMRKS